MSLMPTATATDPSPANPPLYTAGWFTKNHQQYFALALALVNSETDVLNLAQGIFL